jgi:hypothetical protein
MVGPGAPEWLDAAREAGEAFGIQVDAFKLESADPRPDGHVARRMHYLPTDPSASLKAVLATVLCRTH